MRTLNSSKRFLITAVLLALTTVSRPLTASAQEKASLTSAATVRTEPGAPGGARKVAASAALPTYSPSDPNMAITTAPRVSLIEKADTAAAQALSMAIDTMAPWSKDLRGTANAPAGRAPEQTVFNRDDRVRVSNTTAYPYSAICDLEMTFPNGGVRIGTGFFISYRSVLTAGHCVYDRSLGGWARSIKVMPGRNGTTLPYGYAWASNISSVTGWTVSQNRAYDYGSITLANTTLGNRTGYFGYTVESDSFLRNQRNVFNTAGFPGDKSGSGFRPMYFTSGQISSTTSQLLYYYFDIMGGQSGSPIWTYRNGNRYVCGIVTAEYRDGSGPNIGTRVNNDVYNFIRSQP